MPRDKQQHSIMNIKGLDYNTQREPLVLPEYGREIQNMVDYAMTLPTKEERLQCAHFIVRMMATKVPMPTDSANLKQTLWDHLYLMSHKALDIDWPTDVSTAERLLKKPTPMPLPQAEGRIQLRHYGRLISNLAGKLKSMPNGPERDELARLVANQMKRDLATWGHGAPDNERVADDLARLTDGIIQLDLDHFKFERLPQPSAPETNKRKRRR